ncbi:MAG: DUF167 family protein [Deltaproteobacteria bacterium]
MSQAEPGICTIDGDGIVISLHIQPRAAKNELCGRHGNSLKIRLTSPPVDGAANKLCREFLADTFSVSKSAVEIVSGETSRHKRVRVNGDPTRLKLIFDSVSQ